MKISLKLIYLVNLCLDSDQISIAMPSGKSKVYSSDLIGYINVTGLRCVKVLVTLIPFSRL